MKCPACQKEMKHIIAESYHYLESGLDNVILSGIDIFQCPCGEEIVGIPSIDELHTLIGLRLVKKDWLLNGKEIRFLRKNIGVGVQRLPKQMGWTMQPFPAGRMINSELQNPMIFICA